MRPWVKWGLPLLAATPLLAGCGVPDQMTLAPSASIVKDPAPRVTRVRELKRLPGELDKGSTAHALTVNGVQLLVTYYTTEDAKRWGPDSQGTVNVSAQVQGVSRRKIARITGFRLVAPPVEPRGHDVVLVNDTGEFVIGAPYSYGTAFLLPVFMPRTPMVKLRAYVDLEIETKPRSGRYTRQSLIDTLRVSLTPTPENSNGKEATRDDARKA